MVRGNREEMLGTVDRALDLGINYFDTARVYGDGRSESNLGMVLEELQAEVLVGTKVRLTTEDMERIQDVVPESVEGSLRRLRRDYVDLIQLHNPIGMRRQPDRGLVGLDDLEPVVRAFQSLQEEGKVRFWGINGLGGTEALLQAIDTGGAYTIQSCYNLINPSAGRSVPSGFPFQDYRLLIDRAFAKEMGIIAIRVLAGGALSGSDLRHPNADQVVSPIASGSDYADDVRRARVFRLLIEHAYTADLVEAAIRFAVSNPEVSTALVGFSSLDQLTQAAEYVVKGALPSKALEEIGKAWELHSEP